MVTGHPPVGAGFVAGAERDLDPVLWELDLQKRQPLLEAEGDRRHGLASPFLLPTSLLLVLTITQSLPIGQGLSEI